MKGLIVRFRSWLARLLGIRPEPYYVTTTLWTGLTLQAWRSSGLRVNYARDLFRHPRFRDMLSVLHNEAPIPDHEKPVFDAGRVFGYQEAIANLVLMAEPLAKPTPEIEATYEHDNVEQPEEVMK